MNNSAFLDAQLTDFVTIFHSASRLPIAARFFQCDWYLACTGIPFPASLSARVPTVLSYHSTGISTCCPSATTLVLTLAPTYPGQISFTLETLDIRPRGFSPLSRYSFRHSLFHAVHSSLRYCFIPHAMLLYQSITRFLSFGGAFQPRHFRRRTSRPVSYYALFE